MTKLSKFECDSCGEVHGHRTDMREWNIVWKPRHPWEDAYREKLHSCLDCGPNLVTLDASLEEWYVERVDGEVVVKGFLFEESIHPEWKDDSIHWDGKYRQAEIEFIENELTTA